MIFFLRPYRTVTGPDFAALPSNRIVVIRGNTVVEMTDDMIHGRENLWSPGLVSDPLQYAMRVTWPG